jgi:ppGpp synthetase/RelA/SpoT-type nucleotidyltranferase
MANEVVKILRARLKGSSVQFRLSARAKSKKNLREKLVLRWEERPGRYVEIDDIKKDVVDLAGVRIILYMPTPEDNALVEKAIREEWGQDVVAVPHPRKEEKNSKKDEENSKKDSDNSKEEGENSNRGGGNLSKRGYQPRHLGYRAIHYRVLMKESEEEEEDKKYHWMKHDQVEIQVVSALTHAWAEVGHDILYKSYAFGQPTIQEERILDALNGLIQSGDLLLESFQEMLVKRTSQPFKYRDQLTDFLRSFFNSERDMRDGDDEEDDLKPAKLPRGEAIYILFKFLEKKKLDSPLQVRRSLVLLHYPYGHHQKEEQIRRTFKPVPEFDPDMSVAICLIRHLLRNEPYTAPPEPECAKDMLAIMMSTLTTLQLALGTRTPEKARDYLQRTNMTMEQIESINFLLQDPKRHDTLVDGGHSQNAVKPFLKDAWMWFRTSASKPTSLCGFLFRLAEMGCRKELSPKAQIGQLHIGPLSRCSTTDMADETMPLA